MERSRALFGRATGLMPGGVNSPVRAFGAVGGEPVFIERAAGPLLWDADGNEYVDMIGSWGAMIAGHAHPAVLRSVTEAAARGTSFGTPCEAEVRMAEAIVGRVPSVEMVRMVSSGTEAVMSVLRLARAATGRDLVVKFDGNYHGHADHLLVSAGSGVATLGLPDSPGVPAGVAACTLVARYNDAASVRALLSERGDRVAAVVVEPVAGNMGCVEPEPGFLEGLRSMCDGERTLLVFDEVMTGFRVARGGAQERCGVRPDLTAFGKVIGGGMPVGAYGGRRELMESVAPAGPVYQAGTLSGNPLAMAAGLATLDLLDDEAYRRLEAMSARLARGLEAAIGEALSPAGVPFCVQRCGAMLTPFFGVDRVFDAAGARAADHGIFARFFRAMLSRGVHLPPSGYEACFPGITHDEAVMDRVVEAAGAAADEALRGGRQ